jgi:hypothetical protein
MPDLFIIGAGASVPYGFPTGQELFDDIRNLGYNFRNRNAPGNFIDGDFDRLYKNSGINPECTKKAMYEFSCVIKKSTMISIDDFHCR